MNKSNEQLNETKTVKQIQPTNPITGFLLLRGLIILLIALMIPAGNSAHGALLAYEGFDYPDGSDITGKNGGLGWTNAWYEIATFPSTNVAGSLTYIDQSGNKLTTTGNKLRNSGDATASNTSQPSRTLAHYYTATGTNQTTWLACLAQRFGTKDVDADGNSLYGRGANISMADTFDDPDSSPDTLTYRFTYGSHTSPKIPDVWEIDTATPATEIQSTNSIAQISLLVFRIDHVTNTVDIVPNDQVFMWVNPPLGVEPPTNTAAAILGDTELSFNHFEFFAGGNNGTYLQAEWYVDEIRLGTTYADVTPFTPGVPPGGGGSGPTIVSVNFQGRINGPPVTGTDPLLPTDVAGVVAAGNWNNVADADVAEGASCYEGSPTGALVDSTGAATTITLTFSANGGWNNEATATTTGNAKMMHGIIKQSIDDPDNCVASGTFAFNNVPEGQYDLYVYLTTDADDLEANISDNRNLTTYYIKEIHQFDDGDTFVQGLNTDPNGTRDTCSYVKFSNLGTLGSGSIGFTAKPIGGTSFIGVGIAGIQLVKSGSPVISIRRDAAGVVEITYTGTLVSATSVSGPYQPVPGAVSPYKPNLQQTAIQFYQAKN